MQLDIGNEPTLALQGMSDEWDQALPTCKLKYFPIYESLKADRMDIRTDRRTDRRTGATKRIISLLRGR